MTIKFKVKPDIGQKCRIDPPPLPTLYNVDVINDTEAYFIKGKSDMMYFQYFVLDVTSLYCRYKTVLGKAR